MCFYHTSNSANIRESPDPTHKRRGSGDVGQSLGLHYFLGRIFSPPITLQKTQSVVQHQKFLATSAL